MPNPIRTKATVTSVVQYGAGTYSVKLKPDSVIPRHKPGQFLHLTLEDFDPSGGFWPESRVFSIASAPGKPELEIVYSVKGRYTRQMEQRLAPGVVVWLKLPFGDFVIDSAIRPGQDAVLIAGGTGLSPFLPFLEQIALTEFTKGRVCLYYGIRDSEMMLAPGFLDKCAREGIIEMHLFLENAAKSEVPDLSLNAKEGRLDIEQIRADSQKLRDPLFFLSGPPGMIKLFKERLLAAGVEPVNIKMDEWE